MFGSVSVRGICALSVGFHVQRLGYIRSRSYSLYRYVFDAVRNKHDILIGLLLSRKSQQVLQPKKSKRNRGLLDPINEAPVHNILSISLIFNLLTMIQLSRNHRAMVTAQRARMKRSISCDKATGTSPRPCGGGQSMFWSF